MTDEQFQAIIDLLGRMAMSLQDISLNQAQTLTNQRRIMGGTIEPWRSLKAQAEDLKNLAETELIAAKKRVDDEIEKQEDVRQDMQARRVPGQ